MLCISKSFARRVVRQKVRYMATCPDREGNFSAPSPAYTHLPCILHRTSDESARSGPGHGLRFKAEPRGTRRSGGKVTLSRFGHSKSIDD